ncbi:MAG: rhodanese-related sulfurtransferase [Cytophagales bacterium]|nr:rhodanese-related sulfurtransferase [Cytophagales bacterium]
MKILSNKVDKRILKQQLQTREESRLTLSFYTYHTISDPLNFRDRLYTAWSALGVLGRVYIAPEGVNAQLSVERDQFERFKESLRDFDISQGVRLNTAIEDDGKSFYVLKVQVKKKIVADGLRDDTFDAGDSGTHLTANEFNALTEKPDTLLVDMRNHYESEVGHFRNAICPDVDTFKSSLPVVEKLLEDHKNKEIILYCTGGIRCEKASAWMKHRGFSNVFQLDGGIIEYARQVKEQGLENKFVGKNFVFDERLGERISPDVISVCHQCGEACDAHTNCRNEGCHLLFIQCTVCAQKFSGCCSPGCKEIIALPSDAQKELRKGKTQGRMVYKKGRSENIKYKSGSVSSPGKK